jgi:tetratricopeptide (TPR) repeat protein
MLGHLAELQDEWPAVRQANADTVELATRWGFNGTLTLVRRRIALVAMVLDRDEGQFHAKCRQRQPGFARSLHDVALARMAQRLGLAERGLVLLQEALAFSAETGSCFYDAEVHRARGELLAALGRTAEAEAAFISAIETAHSQGARMWELRAAQAFAQFCAGCGQAQRGLELLAPAYAWFREGFDTADLRAAKALIDALSRTTGQGRAARQA